MPPPFRARSHPRLPRRAQYCLKKTCMITQRQLSVCPTMLQNTRKKACSKAEQAWKQRSQAEHGKRKQGMSCQRLQVPIASCSPRSRFGPAAGCVLLRCAEQVRSESALVRLSLSRISIVQGRSCEFFCWTTGPGLWLSQTYQHIPIAVVPGTHLYARTCTFRMRFYSSRWGQLIARGERGGQAAGMLAGARRAPAVEGVFPRARFCVRVVESTPRAL